MMSLSNTKGEIDTMAANPHTNTTEIDSSANSNLSIAALEDAENVYLSTKKTIVIVASLLLAMFVMALDRTIVGTAIPAITDEFQSLGDVGWYGSAYLMTACSFQLLFGKLYTICSVKHVLLTCLALFEVGSIVCGASQSSTTFIIGRAIAGAGAAGIGNGAVTTVTYVVPLAKRPVFQGVGGAVFGLASVIGPLIGGALTSKVSWRWCFWINLPIGGVAAAVVFFFVQLKDTQEKHFKSKAVTFRQKVMELDPLGTLCILPATVCLVLALTWGGAKYNWSNARIIVLLIVSCLLFLSFAAVQVLRPETATIKARVIKQRSIASGLWFIFCLGSAMIVLIYYLPLWFQAIQGVDAIQSGIHLLPSLLSLILGTFSSVFVTKKFGYYTPMMIASSVVMSIGIGLLTTLKANSSARVWIGFQVVAGYGLGLGMQQPMLACQVVLSKKDVPMGSSLLFFVQQLGASIFLAIAQTVFNNRLIAGAATIPGIDPSSVINMGATHLRDTVKPQELGALLVVYNKAIVTVFCVTLGLGCCSIFGALGMEWRNIKQKKSEKDVEKVEKDEQII